MFSLASSLRAHTFTHTRTMCTCAYHQATPRKAFNVTFRRIDNKIKANLRSRNQLGMQVRHIIIIFIIPHDVSRARILLRFYFSSPAWDNRFYDMCCGGTYRGRCQHVHCSFSKPNRRKHRCAYYDKRHIFWIFDFRLAFNVADVVSRRAINLNTQNNSKLNLVPTQRLLLY